jgi:hypothetical protein
MPKLNVKENVEKIEKALEEMTQEVLRLQGSLRVFKGLAENGVEEIDIPEKEEGESKEEEK